MAYNKDELEKAALKAITDNPHIITLQEVILKLPCQSSTFYSHELEKSESIKEAIEKNRIQIKLDLKKKWAKQKNATTEIALYKLAASQEERKILSNSDVTLDTGGNQIQIILQKRETSKD